MLEVARVIQWSGYEYHCASGESFDSVAMGIYGDEKYAADLMNANPDECGKFVFFGGEVLQLPALDIPTRSDEAALANTIAPWRM